MYKFQAANAIINWYRKFKRNNHLICWECNIRLGGKYGYGMCDKCYHRYLLINDPEYIYVFNGKRCIYAEYAEYIKHIELVPMNRTRERCFILKEELMAVCYHPSRIEKWLELGGHELLEAMTE